MDQVQGLAHSIGDPNMLGSVAEVVILMENHMITISKPTDIRYFLYVNTVVMNLNVVYQFLGL